MNVKISKCDVLSKPLFLATNDWYSIKDDKRAGESYKYGKYMLF